MSLSIISSADAGEEDGGSPRLLLADGLISDVINGPSGAVYRDIGKNGSAKDDTSGADRQASGTEVLMRGPDAGGDGSDGMQDSSNANETSPPQSGQAAN